MHIEFIGETTQWRLLNLFYSCISRAKFFIGYFLIRSMWRLTSYDPLALFNILSYNAEDFRIRRVDHGHWLTPPLFPVLHNLEKHISWLCHHHDIDLLLKNFNGWYNVHNVTFVIYCAKWNKWIEWMNWIWLLTGSSLIYHARCEGGLDLSTEQDRWAVSPTFNKSWLLLPREEARMVYWRNEMEI